MLEQLSAGSEYDGVLRQPEGWHGGPKTVATTCRALTSAASRVIVPTGTNWFPIGTITADRHNGGHVKLYTNTEFPHIGRWWNAVQALRGGDLLTQRCSLSCQRDRE